MAAVTTVSLKDALADYLVYLEKVRCLSAHTIRSYSNDMEAWRLWLEEQDEPWEEVDEICVRGFLANMSLRKMTPSSINRRLSSLRGFYDWAYEKTGREDNPFRRTRALKKQKTLPMYLTDGEFEKLIALTGDDFFGKRDRLMMEMLYSTGCRVSELCSMNRDSVKGIEVRVMGKGKKERIVFLGEAARKALSEYLPLRDMKAGERKKDGPLFLDNRGERLTARGVFYLVDRYSVQGGIGKKIGPHTFRHSFATSLINEGADIRMVQEMLGHSSLSTTQVYTHTGIERIRQIHRQSHPHGRSKADSGKLK
ncbi:MAG: tyrosine-type recombinase/integrase [Spirochaetales bacterium]|nr:tyrosine-type recombinase/integrase [Spirochaetales bacterium]